jgi:hypothetical protein
MSVMAGSLDRGYSDWQAGRGVTRSRGEARRTRAVEWILARGSLVRKWCLLYWFALTILLVVRDPTRWLRKEMHLGSAVSILVLLFQAIAVA